MNPYDVYAKTQTHGLTGRALESAVLMKMSNQLKNTQDTWDSLNKQEITDILNKNLKLWQIFQLEMKDPNNPLPKKIKEDVLTLSIFINKRTFEIFYDMDKEKMTILININKNIALGLRGE